MSVGWPRRGRPPPALQGSLLTGRPLLRLPRRAVRRRAERPPSRRRARAATRRPAIRRLSRRRRPVHRAPAREPSGEPVTAPADDPAGRGVTRRGPARRGKDGRVDGTEQVRGRGRDRRGVRDHRRGAGAARGGTDCGIRHVRDEAPAGPHGTQSANGRNGVDTGSNGGPPWPTGPWETRPRRVAGRVAREGRRSRNLSTPLVGPQACEIGTNPYGSQDGCRWTLRMWCGDAAAWLVRASPATRCGASSP